MIRLLRGVFSVRYLSDMSRVLFVLLAGFIFTTPALSVASGINVIDPYVRIVPPGVFITGAYMRIKNTGDVERRLVSVDSSIAQSVELHQHINDRGVMKMRPLKGIRIRAKGEAVLEPYGYHIMLIGLKKQLQEGEHVPLLLHFDDSSSMQIEVPARRP